MATTQASRIQGLGELIRQASVRGSAPVEQWDPPYCGDIGLKIDARGAWSYRDSPISRMPLVQLFARVLRCEKDGKHYLVTPVEKVDIAVVDAPFLAVEMQVDGSGPEQTLTFRTNTDDIVRCESDHPLLFREQVESGGLKPYVRVRGRLYARLTRPLYFDLIELAVATSQDEDAEYFVVSGGSKFPIVPATSDEMYNFDV
ncbi:MAG: DUF1285 domain-containing protein [Alphaproteobacteria bacterium]|nr:DUF1285 domain-containing protein [Alphaproteobacteria bacterium]